MTTPGSDAGTSRETTDQAGSVTDTTRKQAGRVGQTATEAGRDVAGTTREEAGAVVQEARQQARGLAAEARDRAAQQVDDQRSRLAQNIRSVSDELRAMADRSEEKGLATDLTRQASERARDLAGYLDQRSPGDLLEEVREFARRRPGTFLVGAVAAGVVVGRLTRGAVSAAGSDRPSARSGRATRSGYPAAADEGAPEYPGATRTAPAAETTPGTATGTSTGTSSGPETLTEETLAQPGGPRYSTGPGTNPPQDVYPSTGGVRP